MPQTLLNNLGFFESIPNEIIDMIIKKLHPLDIIKMKRTSKFFHNYSITEKAVADEFNGFVKSYQITRYQEMATALCKNDYKAFRPHLKWIDFRTVYSGKNLAEMAAEYLSLLLPEIMEGWPKVLPLDLSRINAFLDKGLENAKAQRDEQIAEFRGAKTFHASDKKMAEELEIEENYKLEESQYFKLKEYLEEQFIKESPLQNIEEQSLEEALIKSNYDEFTKPKKEPELEGDNSEFLLSSDEEVDDEVEESEYEGSLEDEQEENVSDSDSEPETKRARVF